MPAHLTERQNQVYEFIRAYVRDQGKPPTLAEIGRALAIRSTNGVHKLVVALETKGFVRRTRHEARGIELVRDDDPFSFDGDATSALLFARRTTSAEAHRPLPRSPRSFLVDPQLLGGADPDDCLVVRAGDDGMNGAGIRKGDVLAVEEVDWGRIPNGTTVAALVHDHLVVRRLDVANGRLHLRAADRSYPDEVYGPDTPECFVIGRVRAVMRRL